MQERKTLKLISRHRRGHAAVTTAADANIQAPPLVAFGETARLLHELQVHQIELETQNKELRRAEGEANVALEKYADLYNFAPIGYLTLRENGLIRSVNILGARLLGREAARLIGRNLQMFVAEEHASEVQAFLQRAFSGQANAACELVFVRDDRSTRTARISAVAPASGDDCRMVLVDVTKLKRDEVALKGACDQVELMVAERTADLAESNIRMYKDIADRKQSDRELRESEERFRRLLASITNYVYRVDISAGGIVRTLHGDGCQAATGYTPEEYAANPTLWLTMIPSEDQSAVLDAMNRILTSHYTITVDHRVVHKNGTLRWIRSTLVPHHSKSGTLLYYDGIITDITEQHENEEERLRMEQEALRGEKMRALGCLAAGVAHEVRNPLNAIIITAELIAVHTADKPQCLPYLERIRKQVRRIDNLMKDLLELRRPEEAKNRQQHTVQAICMMAIQVWKQSSHVAQFHLITEFMPGSEVACILVDPERMTQVLVNLLENATQHSLAGTDIRVRTAITKDRCVQITVEDQGHGISEDSRLHAFDPLFTTRKGGSGLGLSIVKHIVETYRGEVTISDNTPQPGCTVEIHLPITIEQ